MKSLSKHLTPEATKDPFKDITRTVTTVKLNPFNIPENSQTTKSDMPKPLKVLQNYPKVQKLDLNEENSERESNNTNNESIQHPFLHRREEHSKRNSTTDQGFDEEFEYQHDYFEDDYTTNQPVSFFNDKSSYSGTPYTKQNLNENIKSSQKKMISDPSFLLLQQSNLEKMELYGDYSDFRQFPKFDYSGFKHTDRIAEELKNTKSLNIPKEETTELGKIFTVRNYVRRSSEDSITEDLPTPNIPESPDSTNILQEPTYRLHQETIQEPSSILNFNTINNKILYDDTKDLESQKENQHKRREINDYLALIKEKDIVNYLELKEKELEEKYKDLEEHLTNKFKIETSLYFENIQKEMEQILASKGLSLSKRQELEEEYRNELKAHFQGSLGDHKNTGQKKQLRSIDQLEIKMLEEQIRRELEADIQAKERKILDKIQKKELDLKQIEEETIQQRNELARQKSAFNVQMTKFEQEKKELLKLKKQKQTQIEEDIKLEYKNIQKEAEYLKKEVETCYNQLHDYTSGQKVRSKDNSLSKSKNPKITPQEKGVAISQNKSKKSFSGLKSAINERSCSKSNDKRQITSANMKQKNSKRGVLEKHRNGKSSSLINIQGASSHRNQVPSLRSIDSLEQRNNLESLSQHSTSVKTEQSFAQKDEPKFNPRENFDSKSAIVIKNRHQSKQIVKQNNNQTSNFGNANPQNKSSSKDNTDRYSIKEQSLDKETVYHVDFSDDRINRYLKNKADQDETNQTERLMSQNKPIRKYLYDSVLRDSSVQKKERRVQTEESQMNNSDSKYFPRTDESKVQEVEFGSSYGSRVFQDRDLDSYTKYQEFYGYEEGQNSISDYPEFSQIVDRSFDQVQHFDRRHSKSYQSRYLDGGSNNLSNPFSTPPPNKYSQRQNYSVIHTSNPRVIVFSKSKPREKKNEKWQGVRKEAQGQQHLNFDRRKEPVQGDKENDPRLANLNSQDRFINSASHSSGEKRHNMLRQSNRKTQNKSQSKNIKNYVERILQSQKNFHQQNDIVQDGLFKQRDNSRHSLVKGLDQDARYLLSKDYVIQKDKCPQVVEKHSSISKQGNFFEDTLNLENPTQFSMNMLDMIFEVSNGVIKDTQKILQIKSLRNEIVNLRISDAKLLPKIVVKIGQLSNLDFLLRLQGFEKFSSHYCRKFGFDLTEEEAYSKLNTRRRHTKIVEDMVKDCFLNLEELWKQMFVSQNEKLRFLKSLSLSDKFSVFFKSLNSEIEHLMAVKKKSLRAIELLDLRELLREDFMELSCHYRKISGIKHFMQDREISECVYQIKRTSKDILAYLAKIEKENDGLSPPEECLKYFGVGMDVIAKLDLWEIDYLAKVGQEYTAVFGEHQQAKNQPQKLIQIQ